MTTALAGMSTADALAGVGGGAIGAIGYRIGEYLYRRIKRRTSKP